MSFQALIAGSAQLSCADKALLLLAWIVPEDHKGEIVWRLTNPQAVVVALVGLALLASAKS